MKILFILIVLMIPGMARGSEINKHYIVDCVPGFHHVTSSGNCVKDIVKTPKDGLMIQPPSEITTGVDGSMTIIQPSERELNDALPRWDGTYHRVPSIDEKLSGITTVVDGIYHKVPNINEKLDKIIKLLEEQKLPECVRGKVVQNDCIIRGLK